MLKNAKVIEAHELDKDSIHIGTRFKVLDVEFNEELEYQMVGSAEADPMEGKISDESPVGQALLGKKAGDTVVAETPSGELRFQVIQILK